MFPLLSFSSGFINLYFYTGWIKTDEAYPEVFMYQSCDFLLIFVSSLRIVVKFMGSSTIQNQSTNECQDH